MALFHCCSRSRYSDGGSDGGGACWVFFRGIYDTWSPRWHFHRTADPTMDHSTPLERVRTIPMLTAFHAKCRGSRRLQSGERPRAVDSQTRHAYTRKNIRGPCTRPSHTVWRRDKTGLVLRAYIYPLDDAGTKRDEHEKPFPASDIAPGQRQNSRRQRADSSPILNLTDRVPALRFRLFVGNPFPRKITFAFSTHCLPTFSISRY